MFIIMGEVWIPRNLLRRSLEQHYHQIIFLNT